MRFLFLILISVLSINGGLAESILLGHIVDSKGNELPFVNVYIENSSIGTTSNSHGDFKLKCTSCEVGDVLIFQFVGYKSNRLVLNSEHFYQKIDVVLTEENYQFNDIVLVEGENLANALIRKVIKNKKNLNRNLNDYSTRAYIKSVMKLDYIPEKLPFFFPKDEPIDSNDLGIFYLSEALSDYYWEVPDSYKEKMLASKVSGSSAGISFDRVSNMDINFYDNFIEIGGISQRPFVSPISNNAFAYYTYKLEGVFYESGKLINKVKVQPKRKSDPCFSGYVFIVEDEWVLHSIDLNLKKGVPMEFANNIHFDQQYISQDNFWMLFSNNMRIQFSLFGFTINYDIVNFYSNYVLNGSFEEGFFGNEVFSADEDVTDKDSAYWQEIRPFALTTLEVQDYVEKDSLERYYKSDAYLDSLDKATNHIDISDVLLYGFTINKRKEFKKLKVDGLLTNIAFNPVEGLHLESRMNYTKSFDFEESRKWYNWDFKLGYGFSDEKIKTRLGFKYSPDRIKSRIYGITAFSDLMTINDRDPLSVSMSTYFSLYEKKHYRKLYHADGIDLSIRDNSINGLYLSGKLSWMKRSPVFNNTNYSWKFKSEDYDANNPVLWEKDEVITADVNIVYRHNQKYESNPKYGKRIISNPNPDLYLRFKQGIGIGSDAPRYSLLQLGISERSDLNLLGTMVWDIKGSSFLSKSNLKFIDRVHFMGNETVLLRSDENKLYSGSLLQSFHLLPFHDRSSDKSFFEGHVSHHFNGFILNKIPFVRKLKWQLVSGVNTLLEHEEKPYYEAYIGVENIFKIIRIDWGVELGENFDRNHSILFGVEWNIF